MKQTKLLHDLINQCQVISGACEMDVCKSAQEAIDHARHLLDLLEIECGTKGEERYPKAS
jgi:hypothetical protein